MLKSKDLRRNPIGIFNSILSAPLICILDFILPKRLLSDVPHGPQLAGPQPILLVIFLITNPLVAANVRRQAPRNLKIAGVR